MDLLDEYVQDNFLSHANVLRLVDCYSIYSFYIGAELELRTKYSSPLRKGDNDPSFSIYESRNDDTVIMFKDGATGKFGNVFKFVRYVLGGGEVLVPSKQALLQINSDFGLGLGDEEVGAFKPHLLKPAPIKKLPTNIQVTNRAFPTDEYKKYWDTLDIPKYVQDLYYVTNPKIIHYIAEYHTSIVPKELTIAYEILGKYKIYHPFAEKKYKFRNNYDDNFVEGAMQLKFDKEFAIITKATKEIMWYRAHFDWDTVAGKSENTMITPYFMNSILKPRYKKVFIWLDNDEAGVLAQQKYLDLYPWLVPITMDPAIGKDVTDAYVVYKKFNREEEIINYTKQLIWQNYQ